MAKPQYAVLVISPWRNPNTGEHGEKFIKVGIAYERPSATGFTVYIDAGISVSGKLLITLDNDAVKPSKKAPTAHQPFPDDDIPF